MSRPKIQRQRQPHFDVAVLPFTPALNAVPRRVTRVQGAALVSRWFFPVSARTLETWPVPYIRVPGHPALLDVEALVAEAERRLAACPTLMGGRGTKAS